MPDGHNFADGRRPTGKQGREASKVSAATKPKRATILKEAWCDAARASGLRYPMHLAKAWSATERRHRGTGADPRPLAQHAARHVCQGLIGPDDALQALVLIEWQQREGDAAPVANDPAADLEFAAFVLAQAIANEETKRGLLAKRMRDALAPMFARLAPVAELKEALRELNEGGGRLFVWPQLHQLLEEEAGRYLTSIKAHARGRRHA